MDSSKGVHKDSLPSSADRYFNIWARTSSYFFVIGILCSFLLQSYIFGTENIFQKLIKFSYVVPSISSGSESKNKSCPTYAIYGKRSTESHLEHVFSMLDQMGYKRTSFEEDWDLLWAHDYPFRALSHKMSNLENHQIVNHFPGCGFITNKVDLATSDLSYIPKAFRLPTDKDHFMQYSQEHPKKLFVEKHNEHRNIFIKAANEIDLSSNSTFIQEFVENPYLVDGYKFDVGVYVIITSINPLRIYVYKGDVLFRFCPVKYHPFDAQNIDKYVVGDDYLPIWKLPSLSYYYNDLKFSMKDAFDAYVRMHNGKPELMWEEVENIIRSIVLTKEPKIKEVLKSYKYKQNFFELMRFDFIVDDNLRVFLMEANMSPNLSSAHFKQNVLLYMQVLYSVMNLIGIGSPIKRTSLRPRSPHVEAMISSDKNIVVTKEECSSDNCKKSCISSRCRLCKQCLTDEDNRLLHLAYREHMQQTDTKRIFPKPIKNVTDYNLEEELNGLSSRNQFMVRWFYDKCKRDVTWCF